METDDETCASCNGSGEGMHDGSTCIRCHGSGVENKLESDECEGCGQRKCVCAQLDEVSFSLIFLGLPSTILSAAGIVKKEESTVPAAVNCSLTSIPLPVWTEAVKQGKAEGLSGAAIIERWSREGAGIPIPTIEEWLRTEDAKEWFRTHKAKNNRSGGPK